jgi:acyl-CoA dehydrogenase family member 9
VKRVVSFCEKEIDAGAIDREENIPEPIIKGLGELGVLGLSIPQQFGESGMTQFAYCKVMEQLIVWSR